MISSITQLDERSGLPFNLSFDMCVNKLFLSLVASDTLDKSVLDSDELLT